MSKISAEDLVLVITVVTLGYGSCFALIAYLNDRFN